MKYLLQRVASATVTINDEESRSIGPGLLMYVSIGQDDTSATFRQDVDTFVQKLPHLQLFSDKTGKITQSLLDIDGELMVISNFTLHGRNKKGTQIDFSRAASYDHAQQVYQYLLNQLAGQDIPVTAGKFGAMMHVTSVAEGPVNLIY